MGSVLVSWQIYQGVIKVCANDYNAHRDISHLRFHECFVSVLDKRAAFIGIDFKYGALNYGNKECPVRG